MEYYQQKVIETLSVIIIYFIVKKICFKIINKTLLIRNLLKSRGIIIKKALNVVFILFFFTLLSLIWGVDQSQLAVFIGSVLTIVGVAFFAQWSLLSNITSGIILFFNHPVRINDSIVLLEGKDYIIEGKVKDIGLFFISLETEQGEELTLPNNIFIQKSMKKKKEAPTD